MSRIYQSCASLPTILSLPLPSSYAPIIQEEAMNARACDRM